MTDEKLENIPSNIEEKKPIDDGDVTVWGFIRDILKFTLLSLVVVIPIRVFIAQPFLVSGSSMKPTFHDGEYLVVDEISYYLDKPARGDVIVFKYPYDRSKYFIKRIIGLPGETVDINNNKIAIRNADHPDGLPLDEIYITDKTWGGRTMSVTLNKEEYFVMGDNRNASSDSREWGPLDGSFITGHVKLRLLPITKVEISPGAVDKITPSDTTPSSI